MTAKFRIIANTDLPETGFDDQVALIRATGATFDAKTRTWWLETAQPAANLLNLMFQAVREHHTRVIVEELDIAA